MKKSAGARRSVLGFVRSINFYEDYIPSAVQKKTGKPGKRRVVLSGVKTKQDGTWIPA
jgi:hypothetical protein